MYSEYYWKILWNLINVVYDAQIEWKNGIIRKSVLPFSRAESAGSVLFVRIYKVFQGSMVGGYCTWREE